jgi:hypothetical protein
LGEEKKKRFVYYQRTFSKGEARRLGSCSRKGDRSSFGAAVKAVTLHEKIVEWLRDGVSILPVCRKPFDIIAEGPSRLNWLHRVDEFRNCFLYENIFETNPQFQAVELAIARI